MSLLIAGVGIWIVAHLFKAALPALRDQVEEKLGAGPYRGLISLVIVASLVLIVAGWRAALPQPVYSPPMGPGPVTSVLVLLGLILFFSSKFAGNIKRFIRHPQMTGTLLWGIAHLLANGDSRSLTLFGGLTVWALLEIVLINRRDGPWRRPAPAAIKNDVLPAVIGAVVFAVVLYFHQALFGVAVL
ncbi:MAG: NnrU family protein [Woeseiaceae bacterium]